MGLTLERFGHWTPRYILDRVSLGVWERLNPELPWLTAESIRLLSGMLRPTDRALEWGSGRSTRWFADRVGELTSVESDPEWYGRVKDTLAGRSNVRYLYKECPGGAPEALAAEYANVADSFADESLDFVLVDGQVRDRCALKAIPKIRPGGMLVVDNINWFWPRPSHSPSTAKSWDSATKWREVADVLEAWRSIWTSSGVTDTAIWIKPAGKP
jgi:predicted O-methyltransferase YrrM